MWYCVRRWNAWWFGSDSSIQMNVICVIRLQLVSNSHHDLIWRFCSESKCLSLCCNTLAYGTNMAAPLQVFWCRTLLVTVWLVEIAKVINRILCYWTLYRLIFSDHIKKILPLWKKLLLDHLGFSCPKLKSYKTPQKITTLLKLC